MIAAALPVVVLVVVLVVACATVSISPRPSTVLLNQYDAARVQVYHNGPRCRVVVTTPTTTIETTWARCSWIPQP